LGGDFTLQKLNEIMYVFNLSTHASLIYEGTNFTNKKHKHKSWAILM
jgi:hypothetical protein